MAQRNITLLYPYNKLVKEARCTHYPILLRKFQSAWGGLHSTHPPGLPCEHPPSTQRKCLPGAGEQPEVTREFYSQ